MKLEPTIARRIVFTSALALILLGSAASAALAQESTPVAGDSRPTVKVAGIGTVQVSPDAAVANIGVSITETDLGTALDTANSSMDAVIEAIQGQGIDAADIQTSSIVIQPIQSFDERGNPNDIEQFQVSNMVRVTIRDLDQVGPVMDSSIAAGANSVFGVEFILTDRSEAESAARESAVSDATERATQLALSAGYTLGDAVSIEETSVSSPVAFAGGAGAADEARMSIPVESGSTMITVRIEIVFEIV